MVPVQVGAFSFGAAGVEYGLLGGLSGEAGAASCGDHRQQYGQVLRHRRLQELAGPVELSVVRREGAVSARGMKHGQWDLSKGVWHSRLGCDLHRRDACATFLCPLALRSTAPRTQTRRHTSGYSCPSFPSSAWECISRNSAPKDPAKTIQARYHRPNRTPLRLYAERRPMHSQAELGNEGKIVHGATP